MCHTTLAEWVAGKKLTSSDQKVYTKAHTAQGVKENHHTDHADSSLLWKQDSAHMEIEVNE